MVGMWIAIGALVEIYSSFGSNRTLGATCVTRAWAGETCLDWATLLANATANEGLGNAATADGAGHGDEFTGGTAAWAQTATETAGGFDVSRGSVGIAFVEIIVEGSAACGV